MKRAGKTPVWIFVLVWGAVWGAAEATLGHALHLLPIPGLAGSVMFPIGLACMTRAVRRSGLSAAVWMTAGIAAGLKLTDLVVPGIPAAAVWHPVSAILCQAAVVSIWLNRSRFRRLRPRSGWILAGSWGAIYLGVGGLLARILPGWGIPASGFQSAGSFLFAVTALGGGLIALAGFMPEIPRRMSPARNLLRPLPAWLLLLSAFLLERLN